MTPPSGSIKIVKIGESYLNLNNMTHAQFETSPQGLICTIFFNCQITDRNGCNGIQAVKTFTAGAARELQVILDKLAAGPAVGGF